MIEWLKNVIPLDLGQGKYRFTTKGKVIANDLLPRGGGFALDVGQREGYQTKQLREKGFIVTGVDIDPQLDETIKCDVEQGLPFEDNMFNLVWASEVLEHLYNPRFFVEEVNRVLKHDGVLVLTTPNSYCWLFRLMALFGLTPWRVQNKDHKHFFSIKDINKLFPNAQVYGYNPFTRKQVSWGVGKISPTFVVRMWKE